MTSVGSCLTWESSRKRARLDGGAHAQLLKPLGRAFELVAEVSLEGI